jgi:hypothetical protein
MPTTPDQKSKIKQAFTSAVTYCSVDIQAATIADLYHAEGMRWNVHVTMGESAIVLTKDKRMNGAPKLYLVDIEV